ncbi:MFS general substrate transporter [Polyplosphaeria fusca]|uniref:MFS general substrate transporter n=1 Tax=Polyplosphaeria fusca TaxID=682080 RepID=A0A9P4V432_9PLEO|nr:MFS general substrate transporter [Polyplosphaeria fusca]
MDSQINTSSFLDPSSEPQTENRDTAYWALAFRRSNAPTITELAQRRASQLDSIKTRWSFIVGRAALESQSDLEKQYDSSTLHSSNASGVFTPADPPPSPPAMTRIEEILFIFITCIAQFMSLSALNQTVAPVMVLADHFHIEDYGTLSWFSASFSMSVGTFILPAGRLGDMYGHKRIYLIGWLWFAIWSLISGFGHSSGVIVFSICRAFQGIGPALIVPNAVALIGRTLPLGQKRNIGFACFGACGPLGAAAGAAFAAILADLAWWPWEFWILSIVCVIVMFLAYIILPDEVVVVTPGLKGPERPKFDYWGSITGVSGLVLINFALNQAPLVAWNEPYIGAILAVGCVCMAAFVFVELYATDYPLIPIRGLSKDAVFALTCIVAGWASHGIWAYYLYLFLEHLRGHSALLTAAETSPVAITGVGFAFSTVWLIKHWGVHYVMFIAMTFFMLGALLLGTMPIDQTYWSQTFVSVLIMPGAMNLSYPAANILLSSALPREKQGIAASLVSTMVNYSISCGLGFAGSIDRYVIADAAKRRGWQPSPDNPAPLSDHSQTATEIRLEGLRGAYYFAVGLGGLGMAVAFVYILVSHRRQKLQARQGTPQG